MTSRKAKGRLGIAKGNQKDIDNTNNSIYIYEVRHIFKINILYIKQSMLPTNTKYLLHKNVTTDKLPIC